MPKRARHVKHDPTEPTGSAYVREGGLYIRREDYDKLRALFTRMRELGLPIRDQETVKQIREEYERARAARLAHRRSLTTITPRRRAA